MKTVFLNAKLFVAEFFSSREDIIKPCGSAWVMNNICCIFLSPICISLIVKKQGDIISNNLYAAILLVLAVQLLFLTPLFVGNHIILSGEKFVNVHFIFMRATLRIDEIKNVKVSCGGKGGEYNENLKIIAKDGRETNVNMFLYSRKDLKALCEKLGFPDVIKLSANRGSGKLAE